MFHDLGLPPFLFILGFVTGFISTNTGGGALIITPVLIWLGVSPQSAVASARLASLGTLVSGLLPFHARGKVDYKLALPISVFSIVGAVLGAYLLVSVPDAILDRLIGALTLVLFALYYVYSRKFANSHADHTVSSFRKWLGYLAFIPVGILGGFFGGQSHFSTLILQFVFYKSISESIGTRKVIGLSIVLVALAVYGIHGIIDLRLGLPLICGTLLGSFLGAHYALSRGDEWLERICNVVTVVLAVKMIFF